MKRIVMIAAVGILMLPSPGNASPLADRVLKGKAISSDNMKGNCLACHAIQGAEMPGNLGPPLLQMKLRYPKRKVLHDQIWDATKKNPQSIMPPFGKHGILTDEEVNLVVDYMYSL